MPSVLFADVTFSVPETSYVNGSQLAIFGCLRVTPQHFAANNGTYTLERDGQSCTYGIGTTGESTSWPTPRIWVTVGSPGIIPAVNSCGSGVMVGFSTLRAAVVADSSSAAPSGGCSAATYTQGDYPYGLVDLGVGLYSIDFTAGHFDAPDCESDYIGKSINQTTSFDIVRRQSMSFGAAEIGRWTRALTITIRE
jgi:hypothetical protein